MNPILPGAALGIFGGGELGRGIALAARALGYRVHVLDPDAACAARSVAERCVTAAFDDAVAADELARGCAVVTLETGEIGLASIAAAERHAPVRPSGAVLAVLLDRGRQRDWLGRHGFLVDLGAGEAPLDLAADLSVLVARSATGETAVYPPSLNHHEQRLLDWSVLPGPVPPEVSREAVAIGSGIARALEVEGLLAVGLSLGRDGRLLVGELSPSPHDAFRTTELACATGQLEQLVRAVCGLPLGSVEVVRPAAIVNLPGDLSRGDRAPAFERALALPGVRLHLHGTGPARAGRLMGHLSALGPAAAGAVALARRARALLSA